MVELLLNDLGERGGRWLRCYDAVASTNPAQGGLSFRRIDMQDTGSLPQRGVNTSAAPDAMNVEGLSVDIKVSQNERVCPPVFVHWNLILTARRLRLELLRTRTP